MGLTRGSLRRRVFHDLSVIRVSGACSPGKIPRSQGIQRYLSPEFSESFTTGALRWGLPWNRPETGTPRAKTKTQLGSFLAGGSLAAHFWTPKRSSDERDSNYFLQVGHKTGWEGAWRQFGAPNSRKPRAGVSQNHVCGRSFEMGVS